MTNQNKNIILLIEYIRIAYLKEVAQTLINPLYSIIDTIDVSYQRHYSMTSQNLQSDLRISKKQESKLLNTFDCVLAIQKEDQEKLTHLYHKSHVLLTPHSVITKVLSNPSKTHSSLNIGFVGSAMPPNIQGLNWFLNEVFSQLHGINVFFNIAGAVCQKIVIPEDLKHKTKSHGFVDNIEDFYQQNDLIIAPIFSGGGLKIKTVEALCYGKALITTDIGSEGLTSTKDAFLLYNEANQWIIEIKKIIENYNIIKEQEVNAYNYTLTTFSPKACYGEITKLIQSL